MYMENKGPSRVAEWSRALLLIASCLSPYPSLKSSSGQVKVASNMGLGSDSP